MPLPALAGRPCAAADGLVRNLIIAETALAALAGAKDVLVPKSFSLKPHRRPSQAHTRSPGSVAEPPHG